jgi:hypothetical protein
MTRWFCFATFLKYLKVNKKIENSADCEVRSVIRFLNAQNVCPIEIYRQLIAVYGKGVMNQSNVRKWCGTFNEGRTNVHDEEGSGRPSPITENLKKRIYQHSRINRRFTLDEIREKFFRSLIHEIVTQHLRYKNREKKKEICKMGDTDAY